MTSPAEDHREVAAGFTAVADRVDDWDATAPVDGWVARDVVEHLTTWFPAFLAAGGVVLEVDPSSDDPGPDDPAVAWRAHAAAVQALLDGPDADSAFTHPHVGTMPLQQAVAQFYTADVFMHTWDLARAAGLDPELATDRCEAMLEGMRPIEDLLRGSGQYGPAVPVSDDAPVQDRLVGFIGRDPAWQPPG
jgi:uncharacterized protein (TIGR03086 family)